MAKGENIFRRKDGRWEARYAKGYGLSGKIRYGFCYGKTYKEAKEKATLAKAALLSGKAIPTAGAKRRFSFFCDEWLETNRINLRESTYIKYAAMLGKHIKPKLGDCFPPAISSPLIGEFTDALLFEEGLAPKTVRDILVLLRSILAYTAKRFPGVFPQPDIRFPRECKKETRVLTQDEQKKFIRYLLTDTDECKFGVLLALLTGMRIGELCALRWENISLKEKTIKISATMQRLKDMGEGGEAKTRVVIGDPKSGSSQRTIPMSGDAAKLCKRMRPGKPSAFVLTGTADYMEPRLLQYRMERYTRDCGLEGVHFHTLRHTFATRCVEAGFEIKSLSEILGHANTAITLNLYIHSSMELKRSNMNKLAMAGL